jgi:hypothetical protein
MHPPPLVVPSTHSPISSIPGVVSKTLSTALLPGLSCNLRPRLGSAACKLLRNISTTPTCRAYGSMAVFEAWMALVLFKDAFVLLLCGTTKASSKRTKPIQASKTSMTSTTAAMLRSS